MSLGCLEHCVAYHVFTARASVGLGLRPAMCGRGTGLLGSVISSLEEGQGVITKCLVFFSVCQVRLVDN